MALTQDLSALSRRSRSTGCPREAADVARTGFVIFTALTVLVDLYSNDGLSLCQMQKLAS